MALVLQSIIFSAYLMLIRNKMYILEAARQYLNFYCLKKVAPLTENYQTFQMGVVLFKIIRLIFPVENTKQLRHLAQLDIFGLNFFKLFDKRA